MHYFQRPDVQQSYNALWWRQYGRPDMADRRGVTPSPPKRTLSRMQVVHLDQGNGTTAWCNAQGTAIVLIDDEESAAPHQQICGSCKMEKSQAQIKKTPRTTRPATPAPLTFRQQQQADLAAAQQRAHASSAAPPTPRGRPRHTPVSLQREAPESTASTVVRKPARVIETRVTGKRNCTTVAEAMIRAGKTNEEVWDVISVEFNLDDSKKGYPSWYRSRLRRKGEDV